MPQRDRWGYAPEGHKTHINDLALVCANCHQMIHIAKPWLTVEGLKKLLASGSGDQ